MPTKFVSAAGLLLCASLSVRAVEVTNANDSGAGSLREALASTDPNVTFNAAFFATARTITLASTLPITRAKTITGPGANRLTIDGNNAVRCLHLTLTSATAYAVSISGVTISRGFVAAGDGGGILCTAGAVLTLTDCVLSGNRAGATGGATAHSGGALSFSYSPGGFNAPSFTRCVFSGNSANWNGGAVHLGAGGGVPFIDCTFSGNTAVNDGGGLYNQNGANKLTRCTFSGNTAGRQGGGTALDAGGLAVWGCTFSGNTATAQSGSAISNTAGNLAVNVSTLSGNTATAGGAIFIAATHTATAVRSSIVAGNTGVSGSTDIHGPGTLSAQTSNVIGSGGGIANLANNTKVIGTASPLLAPLARYGGNTDTRPPLPGSPAEVAGAFQTDNGQTFSVDQRNVNFATPPTCGAVQQRAFTLNIVSGGGQTAVINSAFPAPVVIGVTGTSGDPVNGGSIRVRPSINGPSVTPVAEFDAPISGGQVILNLTANGLTGNFNLPIILPTALNVPLVNAGPPEIAVLGNGVSITDGDTTPSAADHTAFGSIAAAAPGLSGVIGRTFTISNTGTGPLLLTGTSRVEVKDRAGHFQLAAQPAASIAAGASLTFTVNYDPQSAGSHTATVEIRNNDSDENPFEFTISGTGLGASPVVLPLNGLTIAPRAAGGRTVSATIPAGAAYASQTFTLKYSPDLVTWTTLTTGVADSAGTVSFSAIADPGATGPVRFYRVERP